MGNGLAALTTGLSGFGLTWLVQSSVLLALGLVAGRVLRRSGPAVQSGVYRTTLAAVLICPVASVAFFAVGFDGLSLRLPSPATPAPPELVPPPTLPMIELAARSNVPLLDLRVGEREIPPTSMPANRAEAMASASRPAPKVMSPRLSMSPVAIAAYALAVWLVGATFMVVRLWVGQTRMRRLRASAVPAEAGAEALCSDVARQMNVAPPTVWRSPFLFSPCLDGLRRPAILLPDDLGKNLRETFVHELAHLARRDGLWNLVRRSATAGLWLQPLVWLLSRRLEVAAEEVCDDYVVYFGAERAHYAGHLLELAGRALPPVAPASVGMISLRSMLARRIVRILDTSRSLSTRAGTRAVLAMLAVGLTLTTFASLLGIDGRRPAMARMSAEAGDPKPDPADKTIRGQVVGPDGKPVAKAAVIAWRVRLDSRIDDQHATRMAVALERKITGSNGRYEFHFETPEIAADARLIATAPGFGLGYSLKEQQIRLTAGDLPIDGRLVDLEGRPVAGVKVSLGQVLLPQTEVAQEAVSPKKAGEPLTKMRAPSGAQVSRGDSVSMVGRLILDADGLLPDGVVTDSDGRFRIAGLGRDVLANLTLSGPTIALKKVRVVTRAMDRVNDAPRDAAFQGVEELAIHGASCTIAVEPARPIEGFVRDAQTNQPIPGAVVTAAALSGSTLMIDGSILTETDAHGHYRLIGLPKEGAQGHKLAVYPPFDRPYFVTRRIEAPARPGFEPLKLDIALKSGTWITGKVTDAVTGKPVAAAVDYFPLLSNGHAKDYPNFDPNITASVGIKTRYKTDKEGRFRIVGLPGEGVVTAHTDDKSYLGGLGAESIKGRTEQNQLFTYDHIYPALYQSLKPVNVPEGATSFACDLGVDPGKSVLLRIVDQAEAPVTNTVVWGRHPEGTDHGDQNLYNESVARIAGLEPGKPRTVLILRRDRKIGAVLSISPEEPRNAAEMTVTLRPTATLTGRLVDGEGQPAKGGVRVELTREAGALFRRIPVATAVLDSTGRFRCEVIPAGGPYQVTAANRLDYGMSRRMEPEAFKPFELAKNLKLESGQELDFGTLDANTGKRVQDAPPRKAAGADFPITGRIVNLEGRPVAGATVRIMSYATSRSGDLTLWLDAVRSDQPAGIARQHLNHFEVPATAPLKVTTDQHGRFRFEGFGAERVAHLLLEGPTIASAFFTVVTRPIESFHARGFPLIPGPGTETIYGANFTYSAAPGRPVEGIVRDAQTRKPLPRVIVQSSRRLHTSTAVIPYLETTSDDQGRFRLIGLPKKRVPQQRAIVGDQNFLTVLPNDDQPYFMRNIAVPDPPGVEPVSMEVELHRGIWITGKVTDKKTGQPIKDVPLHYLPFLENKFAQGMPEFGPNRSVLVIVQDRYKTKSDGAYRLVGLPGRAIVGAAPSDRVPYRFGFGSEAIKGMDERGHFATWWNPFPPGKTWPLSMKEINPAEGIETVHVDLELDPGDSVRVRVVDPKGKPVPGSSVIRRMSTSNGETMPQADFDVVALGPGEERTMLVRHEGRKLGKAVRIHPGDDKAGPVMVTLEPLATIVGRIEDADGNPVSGATVRTRLWPSGSNDPSLPAVATAKDGRFQVPDVPAGVDYSLVISSRSNPIGRSMVTTQTKVRPGETSDVGEIRSKGD